MSSLFRKPGNVSFDEIERYVESYDGSNDLLFFKYIYLLCKKSIIDRRIKMPNSEALNSVSIKCATDVFDIMFNERSLSFDDAFGRVIKSIVSSTKATIKDENISENSLEDHIITLYEKSNAYGASNLLHYSDYILLCMKKIPVRKGSNEWLNIYKSVLLSFNKTLNYYKETMLDFTITIYPKIVLYNCDKRYRNLVSSIVLKLAYNVRDNFFKMSKVKHF